MKLTQGQRDVLQQMNSEDSEDDYNTELVYENGTCYLGDNHIDSRILFGLLRLCAISLDPYSKVGQLERYHINETGRNLLKE